MNKIMYSFYPSWTIILTLIGTSFAAVEVSLNGVFIYVLQYFLGDEIKKNMLGGACGKFGRRGWGVYRVVVSRPEGKRQLGRPRLNERIILTLRRLMSYIYGAPILDVSRSHTQRCSTVGRTPLDE